MTKQVKGSEGGEMDRTSRTESGSIADVLFTGGVIVKVDLECKRITRRLQLFIKKNKKGWQKSSSRGHMITPEEGRTAQGILPGKETLPSVALTSP